MEIATYFIYTWVTCIFNHSFQEAQHVLSEYYLSRRHEDPKHTGLAEHWLTRAAGNGHSLAAYNLAVAHLRGDLTNQNERTPEKTEPPTREVVHGLLSQAVKGGVHEALSLLHLCGHGQCSKRQKRSSSNTKGQWTRICFAPYSLANLPLIIYEHSNQFIPFTRFHPINKRWIWSL